MTMNEIAVFNDAITDSMKKSTHENALSMVKMFVKITTSEIASA